MRDLSVKADLHCQVFGPDDTVNFRDLIVVGEIRHPTYGEFRICTTEQIPFRLVIMSQSRGRRCATINLDPIVEAVALKVIQNA